MGGKSWTEQELATVRELYPAANWRALLSALPGKTKAAIRCQVITLGIKKLRNSRTSWTGAEIVALRKLYPNARWEKICEAIPRHPRPSIGKKANEIGLKRDRAEKQSRYGIIQRLRKTRMSRGVTQKHVAGMIGIHTVQLAKWERGEQLPRLRGLFDWVEALGFRLELQGGTRG